MRRRILALVVGMTTLVVLAFAIPLVVFIRNNAHDDGVNGLRDEATYLARYLRSSNQARTATQITAALSELSGDRAASVQLSNGGRVLGTLPPGGLADLPPLAQYGGGSGYGAGSGGSGSGGSGSGGSTASPASSPSPGSDDGYRGPQGPGDGPDRDIAPQPYRGGLLVQLVVPTFSGFGSSSAAASVYTVRVWASDGTVRSGQTKPLALLGGVALALLVVGIVAGEVLTRRIVRPLVDTAGTAQRLSTGDTTARAPSSGPPEVAGVGLALNRLADRIDELIAEERETVADLSHRLRTPLTALRLDAEALRDPVEAERVGGHVGTLERMLTSVIRAARRPQREGRIPSCDATAVVAERVEFWSALAEDQLRATTVSLPDEPVTVRAADEDLAAAVDALLENVVAHTPEGVAFAVTLTPTDTGALLTVADDGPGMPAGAAERGRSDRGGTGLGLDIARRCAESTGGGLGIAAAPSGGAAVTLDLRAP